MSVVRLSYSGHKKVLNWILSFQGQYRLIICDGTELSSVNCGPQAIYLNTNFKIFFLTLSQKMSSKVGNGFDFLYLSVWCMVQDQLQHGHWGVVTHNSPHVTCLNFCLLCCQNVSTYLWFTCYATVLSKCLWTVLLTKSGKPGKSGNSNREDISATS